MAVAWSQYGLLNGLGASATFLQLQKNQFCTFRVCYTAQSKVWCDQETDSNVCSGSEGKLQPPKPTSHVLLTEGLPFFLSL